MRRCLTDLPQMPRYGWIGETHAACLSGTIKGERRMRIAILLALALAGCVERQLAERLRNLVGQDVHIAFQRLGYPNASRQIAGDTVYTWSTDRRTVMTLPTANTTTGMVAGTPFTATTYGTEDVPLQFFCTLELVASADGKIKTYQFSGNDAGCKRYNDALDD